MFYSHTIGENKIGISMVSVLRKIYLLPLTRIGYR